MKEPLIFSYHDEACNKDGLISKAEAVWPQHLVRQTGPDLPECSELDVVRHFTRLSQLNMSIDSHFYPLGSCTMKYNPKICHQLALLPGFSRQHPLAPESMSQGILACLYDLQEWLKEIGGFHAVGLAPMAGAQGEFAGVAMIAAYHRARGDHERTEFLVPDAAHGTNPASAVMCGFKVIEVKSKADGDVDMKDLESKLSSRTAGIMLTNPSTLGVFERNIETIASMVHDSGGLLYYDGANLNAILGKVRPGDMGFDVMHMNLHKTLATPHGGGGPGAGPVAVAKRLEPYLPIPRVGKSDGTYFWHDQKTCPESIGRLTSFAGNTAILLRAYIYALLLGKEGFQRVGELATLNANYLLHRLKKAGFEAAFPERRASHEFIVTLKKLQKEKNISARDFVKRLLDKGFHAPTVYFPLLVPECLLIEPTETESRDTLDRFITAMIEVMEECHQHPEKVLTAPHHFSVGRLDEVKAAKELRVTE